MPQPTDDVGVLVTSMMNAISEIIQMQKSLRKMLAVHTDAIKALQDRAEQSELEKLNPGTVN